MNETSKKPYVCKRLRMCEYLIKKGFKPAATIPDADNPRYNWWLFDNAPELYAAVNEYFKTMLISKK